MSASSKKVIIAALIGTRLLREPFGWMEGTAMALIIGGIALAERKPAGD